uniref:Inositol 1,4,5-trisphosphate receptor-interacting protein n=1 Tax=Strigops habroptila TaxID=2489341 RepID=A0A672TQV9_STRHB
MPSIETGGSYLEAPDRCSGRAGYRSAGGEQSYPLPLLFPLSLLSLVVAVVVLYHTLVAGLLLSQPVGVTFFRFSSPSLREQGGKRGERVAFPDKAVLASFYEKRILGTTGDVARMREMVEGFADDLLEALRSVCNRDADMEVEDCMGVGSMYENWRVRKPFVCDLIVPFAPPEPYRFRCQTKLGEDMLCLLHSQANTTRPSSEMEDLLCFKNTQYLDADQVMKWFQIAVTKAWNRISHKYEFDLSFSLLDSPGALKIKFRSGKSIAFNLTPVVQYENSDVYFISHFPRSSLAAELPSSTRWFLTFAVYERRFIQLVSKTLPANACHVSCLQILSFVHGKQCSLTGPSGLSNYHLKTVMLHLLQARPSQDWAPEKLEARLQDVLKFLEKCLHEKKLYHFFIGNGKVPAELGFPIIFQRAEPLNLFRPFGRCWVLVFRFVSFPYLRAARLRSAKRQRTAEGFAFIKEAVLQNYPVIKPVAAVW